MRSKISEDSLDRARSCISSLEATANMLRIFTFSQALPIFVKKTMMPMWQWQRWFRLIPKGESPTGTWSRGTKIIKPSFKGAFVFFAGSSDSGSDLVCYERSLRKSEGDCCCNCYPFCCHGCDMFICSFHDHSMNANH